MTEPSETLEYSQETLGFLQQNSLRELLQQEDDPERFLNEEVWPVVQDFLEDLGMDLKEEYTIRLSDRIFEGDKSFDFAGESGAIADQINDEKAIRLNPDTDWSTLALIAHEATHKYHGELKQPAREIGGRHRVFRPLDGWVQYMDIGNGIDFQYSSLAHQRPERLDKIGELGDKEVEKWQEKTKEEEERLSESYREKFGHLGRGFEGLLRGTNISSKALEEIREDYGEETVQEVKEWYKKNSDLYKETVKNTRKSSSLVSAALKREMELAGIDQENYSDANYDEGFTMAVTLFALSGLDEEKWSNYLESDHEYSEEPMKTITSQIYKRAKEAEGENIIEKMKKGLELQDQNYKEGRFLLEKS